MDSWIYESGLQERGPREKSNLGIISPEMLFKATGQQELCDGVTGGKPSKHSVLAESQMGKGARRGARGQCAKCYSQVK